MRSSFIVISCVAVALFLNACGSTTPEDRMNKASEYIAQRDMLSAESELRKVVDKSSEHPMAMQARFQLARIYIEEQRFNEAIEELEVVVDALPQSDPLARESFKLYLQVLSQTGQFDKALAKMDEMEKLHAKDPGMELNFKVGRADLLINAQQTTPAREILMPLLEETTDTRTALLYTNLIHKSYRADGNTSGAIEFLTRRYESVPEDFDNKIQLSVMLALAYGAVEDYENTRKYVQEATNHYDVALSREIQPQVKATIVDDLGSLYKDVGNLPGAEVIYQTFLDSNIPQLALPGVAGLAEVRVRNGDTSAAIQLYREYGEKYPQTGLLARAAQLEDMARSGVLAVHAPVDTSTLTRRWNEDSTITLKNLNSNTFTTQPATAWPVSASNADAAASSEDAALTSTLTETIATTAPQSVPVSEANALGTQSAVDSGEVVRDQGESLERNVGAQVPNDAADSERTVINPILSAVDRPLGTDLATTVSE